MPRTGPSTPPPPDVPRTLGERLRSLRMAWGWTQGQLAAALNTDQTAISAWELDKTRPSGAALLSIAHLFGLGLEALDGAGTFPPPARTDSALPGLNLPPVSGAGALVDLGNGHTTQLPDSQEGILKLVEAGRQGRRFWIVLE